MYLLDTNTCIRYLNGTSTNILFRFEKSSPQQISICSVVKAELYYGAMKSRNPTLNQSKLEIFFDQFRSLPFDDNAAKIYGTIRTQLFQIGKPIGPNDLMIASIAISSQLTLVTNNIKEFSRVKFLKFEDWEI